MWFGWRTLSLECWREGTEGGRARRKEPAVAATGTTLLWEHRERGAKGRPRVSIACNNSDKTTYQERGERSCVG